MQPRVGLYLFTAGMPERPAVVHNTAIQIMKQESEGGEERKRTGRRKQRLLVANLPAGL